MSESQFGINETKRLGVEPWACTHCLKMWLEFKEFISPGSKIITSALILIVCCFLTHRAADTVLLCLNLLFMLHPSLPGQMLAVNFTLVCFFHIKKHQHVKHFKWSLLQPKDTGGESCHIRCAVDSEVWKRSPVNMK